MKISHPVIVMDMQHLKPMPQPRDKPFKINPNKVRMPGVKAESQHLCMISIQMERLMYTKMNLIGTRQNKKQNITVNALESFIPK